jgi:hypothetical protein
MFIQVFDTEKYFFQLTAETLRHARIQYVSRGFIWLVEVSPSKWDQYSNRINDQIEDAQFRKLPHVCKSLIFIRIHLIYLRLNSRMKTPNDAA